MMIKTLDRWNGERLKNPFEKARDCKSVEAIRCISSGSGTRFEAIRKHYEGIRKYYEGIRKRFEPIQTRFEGVRKRFGGVRKRFGGIRRHFEAIRNGHFFRGDF